MNVYHDKHDILTYLLILHCRPFLCTFERIQIFKHRLLQSKETLWRWWATSRTQKSDTKKGIVLVSSSQWGCSIFCERLSWQEAQYSSGGGIRVRRQSCISRAYLDFKILRSDEDQIVTPFAQILATLKDVRSSLSHMQLNTHPQDVSRAFLDKFRMPSKKVWVWLHCHHYF